MRPTSSSATAPTKPAVPPSSAIPAVVLATEPPDTKRGVPIACCTATAVSRSIRVIDPLASPVQRELFVARDLNDVKQG